MVAVLVHQNVPNLQKIAHYFWRQKIPFFRRIMLSGYVDGDGQISEAEFGSLLGVEATVKKPAAAASGEVKYFDTK